MWFKHPAWIPVAWIGSVLNVAAVWFAAQPAQPWHATTHALLAVLFAFGAQHLASRRKLATGMSALTRQELEGRLAGADSHQLEQSLDAIAVEVERIGENQRYLTKLLTERDAHIPKD